MAPAELLSAGHQRLVRHQDSPAGGALKIDVSLFLGRYGWGVDYWVKSDASLVLPRARRATRRADELWKHTCLELFLRPGNAKRYYEFNFSPSTQWAAYEFDDYRQGMRPLHMGAPSIYSSMKRDNLHLHARLDWRDRPENTVWSIGLAAVIETASGERAYWALKHPKKGPPDFHDPAGFVATLSPYPQSSPRT